VTKLRHTSCSVLVASTAFRSFYVTQDPSGFLAGCRAGGARSRVTRHGWRPASNRTPAGAARVLACCRNGRPVGPTRTRAVRDGSPGLRAANGETGPALAVPDRW